MKSYTVTYIIKFQRMDHIRTMKVEAKNLKEARRVFDEKYAATGSARHPFRIEIKLNK